MSAFPQLLQALLRPQGYPHPIGTVERIETHVSWVLLTGEFAHKIKRPVRYLFVDLRSAEHREFLCHEEVRLNRRFAPHLYLEVCPIASLHGKARLQGPGPVIEHAVKIRQFRREDELDRLLDAARIEPAELETFGSELARIHTHLPRADPAQEWGRAIRHARADHGQCRRMRARGRSTGRYSAAALDTHVTVSAARCPDGADG